MKEQHHFGGYPMARKKRPGKGGTNQWRRQPPPELPSSDYLLDAAQEHWPHILRLYRLFEDRKPILLLDIQEQQIYAYPYQEFKADLNERSQRILEEQYQQALRENKLVVFVRDNEKRRLVSFAIDLE
jgi:hypothetical protein